MSKNHRRSKSAESRKKAATETQAVLRDLKHVLHNLSEVVTRFEKCLSQFDLSPSDDDEQYISAEEEIEPKPATTVRQRITFLKQKSLVESAQPQKKTEVKKASSFLSATEKKKKLHRQVSVTHEAVNTTVVNNVEEEMRNNAIHVNNLKKKFESKIRRISDSSEDLLEVNGEDEDKKSSDEVVNNEIEMIKNIRRTSGAKPVSHIKKKFEKRSSQSFDSGDDIIISNVEPAKKSDNINVNVQDLKMKFELEKKDVISVPLKPRNEEVVKSVTTSDERRISEEDKEKMKKVLRYFQSQRK